MVNYISLINNFWFLSEEHDFRPIDIALYFYLLKIANGLSWKTSFRRNNKEIMAKLGINSRHTLNDARNRLKVAGLIECTTYSGKPFSTYTIIDTCAKNAQVTAQVTAQVGAQVGAHLNKTKTKTKIKENIKKPQPKEAELPLKVGTPKKQAVDIPPPSLGEVVAICTEKGMSEEEAKQFYYYYDAQGWVTSTGQKIKRIDSMVNRWISNGKQKKKEDGRFKDNATKKQERNDEIARDIISRYT